MSASSLTSRLLARCGRRGVIPAVYELAKSTARFYSPKGAQLPVVEEMRERALQGGGVDRMDKLHKKVRTTK